MSTESQRQDGREGPLTLLNAAIETMNHAKRFSFIPSATVIFGTVSTILTMIKVYSLIFCDEASQVHV